MKNVVTEIFQERDNNLKQNTSIVLYGVPEKKSGAQDVSTILHSINVYCTISKIQRLGKPLPECNKASTTDVGQNELSRKPDQLRPLLVTFGTEAE